MVGQLLSLMASSSASAPIAFFDGFSSFAMLQRAPARATLYGTLGDGGTGATLTITPSGEAVAATVGADGASWSATLGSS